MPIFTKTRPTVKPTRIAPQTSTPFGAGILPGTNFPTLLDSILTADGSVSLHEWPTATEEEGRYSVSHYRLGKPTERHTFDSLGEAQAMVRHLTQPLPVSGGSPETAPETVQERPETISPSQKPYTAVDVAWEAENTPLNGSMYTVVMPPLCGGSPEPVCGISGHWSMPGEDDDREESLDFSSRVNLLPDPVSSGFDSDAGGAFGMACDAEL